MNDFDNCRRLSVEKVEGTGPSAEPVGECAELSGNQTTLNRSIIDIIHIVFLIPKVTFHQFC